MKLPPTKNVGGWLAHLATKDPRFGNAHLTKERIKKILRRRNIQHDKVFVEDRTGIVADERTVEIRHNRRILGFHIACT